MKFPDRADQLRRTWFVLGMSLAGRLFNAALLMLAGLAIVRAQVSYVSPAYQYSTIAGIPPGASDNIDGPPASVRFSAPRGVTVDQSGNSDGGLGVASFNHPGGVAVDQYGTVYVADTGNATIRKITPAGLVSTLAGSAGVKGTSDGLGTAARFSSPNCVSIDSGGNLYVGDLSAVRKIAPNGSVTTLAGTSAAQGFANGAGSTARFVSINGIAADAAGNIYLTDGGSFPGNGTYLVRRISTADIVSTVAGVTGTVGNLGRPSISLP